VNEPRVISEPLGGSPLSARAAAGEAPSEWYTPRPRTPDEWRRHLLAVGASQRAGWADALAPALELSGPAATRLRRVLDAGGVLVTTGQQPGLFGGPIYTWSKAIGTLALADALEEATGVPVAPIFWAATDDSDFAESSWTMVTRPGGADELRLAGPAPAGLSMAQVPLGDDVKGLLERLEQGAGSASWREPLEVVRYAYRSGQTVGAAYVELLRALLGPLEVAVLDAAHPSVRRAASPILRAALRDAKPLADALAERSAALTAAGHRPQVAEVGGLSLVFGVAGGERRRIRTSDAPAAAVDAPPDGLSPNVLLRPVVERALFPTAAYVAGPAELAYFAQSSAVADALELSRPLAVPRWSCTIVEPHVARILEKFGLTIADLRDPHAAETRLARASVPSEVSGAVARLRAAIDRSVATLTDEGGEIVPPTAIAGAGRAMEHRLARLERRFAAAMKRRLAGELEQIGTARGSLFPAGRRQERALNLIPLLARYGPDLLDGMREQALAHAEAMVGSAGVARGSRPAGRSAPTPAT
jgi:bacillithiol biosynthesis cysteine-adding enzyme BshC